MELAFGLALVGLVGMAVLLGWLLFALTNRHGQLLLEQQQLAERLLQLENQQDPAPAAGEPIGPPASATRPPPTAASTRRPGGKVLLLTPLEDAASPIGEYCDRLLRLTYPHGLISLGFIESDSTDDTLERLRAQLPSLRNEFRRVGLWKRDFGCRLPTPDPRSSPELQLERQAVLARLRNQLLFHALDDEDWVLWLDVDVIRYPADLIERLLATGKEIVQPHCRLDDGGPSPDLNARRTENDLVELDAVGGPVLLVRADVHRDGLIFPPFQYGQANPRGHSGHHPASAGELNGEIGAAGLGLLAHDLGYTCWGLPNLEVLRARK